MGDNGLHGLSCSYPGVPGFVAKVLAYLHKKGSANTNTTVVHNKEAIFSSFARGKMRVKTNLWRGWITYKHCWYVHTHTHILVPTCFFVLFYTLRHTSCMHDQELDFQMNKKMHKNVL